MYSKFTLCFLVISFFANQIDAKATLTKHDVSYVKKMFNEFVSSSIFQQTKWESLNAANYELLHSTIKEISPNLTESGTITFPININLPGQYSWLFFNSNETKIEGLSLPKISVSQNGNLWSFRWDLNLSSFKIHGDYKVNYSSMGDGWRYNSYDFYDYHIATKGLEIFLVLDIKLPLFGKMRVENSFLAFSGEKLDMYFDKLEYSWPYFNLVPHFIDQERFDEITFVVELVARVMEWYWNMFSREYINGVIENCSVSDILLGKYGCLNFDWWWE